MIPFILSVEDDKVASAVLRIAMKQCGFCRDFLAFTDSSFAVEYLKEILAGTKPHPVLIFLDLNMPQMDGWEFLEVFQDNYAEKFPDTRIIALTSSLYPEDRFRVLAYPFVLDFISKPISTSLLEDLKQKKPLSTYFE